MAFPLYRSYLREIKLLPHLYLRQFFKIVARDDIQTILTTNDAQLRAHRIASVSKSIKLVRRANMGQTKTFDRILDLAYGRKGKLRWELMKPLLSDSGVPLPQPFIAVDKKSRPPVYSPALKVLLTSAFSRSTKPLKIGNLVNPPVLPARVDPSSPDARIFGPLSKRREVNIRRRYFASEWKKISPPIEVHMGLDASTSPNKKHLIPKFGVQIGVFEDIEKTIGSLKAPRPLPRRERFPGQGYSETGTRAGHSSRWLKRRYRSLLNRLPILLYNPSDNSQPSGPFSVQRSKLSLPPYQRPIAYLPEVDSTTLAWLESPLTNKSICRLE